MLEEMLVMTDVIKLTAKDAENNNDNVMNCISSKYENNVLELPKFRDLHLLNVSIWNFDDFSLEYLNEGFFGKVYKAWHVPTNELLVLKNIKDTEETEHVQSFMQEVSLLCRLSHHNVLKIKGITFQDGQLCCLSEYIDGGSLQDFLYNPNDLDLSWLLLLNITLDVSKGMNYLHDQGVIHRDLNSKNILLREIRKDRYEAVIIDFGLSYQQQPDLNSPDSEEVPSGPSGSAFYIAPELFKGKHCSKKTDVFAFGIVLCEMISGCPGAYPEEVPRSNDFGLNVEEFSELVSDCPSAFLNLAVRCCQVKPSYRPFFHDIMKIVDIIIDRCIEQSFENIESVVITPREHDISISATGHDDYILDQCLLCNCDTSGGEINISGHISNIGFKETFDRFGGVQRTGSRKLMRAYFKRCTECGGRVLDLDGDVIDDANDDDILLNTTNDTIEAKDDDNDESEKTQLPVSNCPNEPAEEKAVSNEQSLPRDIADVSISEDNAVDTSLVPVDRSPPVVKLRSTTLEKVQRHQAGSLLRQINSDISTRTSLLAQHTPGRLPRFFTHIMRKRKSQYFRNNKDSEKRGSRLSLHKIFQFSSPGGSSSNKLSGDGSSGSKIGTPKTPKSTPTSPGVYNGRRRFTFSKLKVDKEIFDSRRLSMPITDNRDCVSAGPSSPEQEHAPTPFSSKSLKDLNDLRVGEDEYDNEDNAEIALSGRTGKRNSTHKRYSSHYKGLGSSKKHSRSLIDLLFRK